MSIPRGWAWCSSPHRTARITAFRDVCANQRERERTGCQNQEPSCVGQRTSSTDGQHLLSRENRIRGVLCSNKGVQSLRIRRAEPSNHFKIEMIKELKMVSRNTHTCYLHRMSLFVPLCSLKPQTFQLSLNSQTRLQDISTVKLSF